MRAQTAAAAVEFIKYMTNEWRPALLEEKASYENLSTAAWLIMTLAILPAHTRLPGKTGRNLRAVAQCRYQALWDWETTSGDAEGNQAKICRPRRIQEADRMRYVPVMTGRVPGSSRIRQPAGRKEHMDDRACLAVSSSYIR